ncbi:MAG: hypothetical protein A2Y38_19255 [Spirochaetes bacterium GWB1_59_5]|nr:MAG: hypothetical protein A2Y38_19255 [Spirochaetes bacterium GWB1_59_5]
MPVWVKKIVILVVAALSIYLCFGWGTTVMPVDPLAHTVVAATVAPLYQVGCPSDSGIPAWECTMWAQANNNFTALRNGVVGSAGTLVGRVVDGGPIALNGANDGGGMDSSYTGYVTYSPSSTATRISASIPYYTYGITGTFVDANEVLRCHLKTTYADNTSVETDGGANNTDFTADGGTADVGLAFNGNPGALVPPKNGTYITSFGVRCMSDAGTSDVGITFTLNAEEM